jgi:hypothetical protein
VQCKGVRKIRFHLTRSLTRVPKFSSKSKIKKNRKSFYPLLNAEYKTAQELLISTYLELEEDIEKYGDAPDVKKKKYWKMILELCFNTLVWIAEGWDRDRVKRVFKGTKHGSLKSRNVISVLNVIRRLNKRWNDFAIALDFSSFECITDILRVHIHPELKGIQNHYIEVKEGKTNTEMINAIKSRSQKVYFSFFDIFGDRVIKQIELHFRQRRTADEHLSIMRADQGGVFDTKDGKLHVLLGSIPRMYYVKGVKNLLKYLKSSPLGFFVVDGCLWVGAARISEPKDLEVADFLGRHSIHHFFSPECAMCTNQAGWQKELADLKIFDGLRMFGSVPFEGLIGKPISDRDMLDILFGRIRFFYHLDGDRFIDLCGKIGLKAGYSTEKEFNRWRSSGHHYVIGFKNRLLWTKSKKGEATFYFTEGVLHDMCLNWIHPYWWARQDFDALFSATHNMQGAEASRTHVRFPASSSR